MLLKLWSAKLHKSQNHFHFIFSTDITFKYTFLHFKKKTWLCAQHKRETASIPMQAWDLKKVLKMFQIFEAPRAVSSFQFKFLDV